MIPLSKIGVTAAKEKQFLSKGITTVEELTEFFPRKYYDFRECTKIRDAKCDTFCRISGEVVSRRCYERAEVFLRDDTGEIKLTWFAGCYFYDRMEPGTIWTFCGKVSEYNGMKNMTQPILHAEGANRLAYIHPVYSKIKGMADKYLIEKITAALAEVKAHQTWTEADTVARSMGLMDKAEAISELHLPSSGEKWKAAKKRAAYDQIYEFYETLYSRKRSKAMVPGKKLDSNNKTLDFISSLPFTLTLDQKKAVDEVMEVTREGRCLNHLITGDVGCGKTAVALIAAILAQENGYQTVIMAPTQVLAKQHFEEMSKMSAGTGVNFALLTGEAKAKERKAIYAGLADGTIHVLIGTHAVLDADIQFHALGMTIVDEEHRFGTQQKKLMESVARSGAHHLSMTATPIPRSYASAIYGNSLSIIPIETMPAGRKPVITQVVTDIEKMYEGLLSEVRAGHQAYVICPFIEESDNEKFRDVHSVAETTDGLMRWLQFNAPEVTVSCISGDMKQKDILAEIDRFAAGETHILVSTTIVEVGVNVPNATAIAILNAERFGLSALHQLRGRVGRKGDQGYCYLLADQISDKLQAFCNHSSGFDIARIDMELRGPGDILGDNQTGDSKIIEQILRRPNLAKRIQAHFEEEFI